MKQHLHKLALMMVVAAIAALATGCSTLDDSNKAQRRNGPVDQYTSDDRKVQTTVWSSRKVESSWEWCLPSVAAAKGAGAGAATDETGRVWTQTIQGGNGWRGQYDHMGRMTGSEGYRNGDNVLSAVVKAPLRDVSLGRITVKCESTGGLDVDLPTEHESAREQVGPEYLGAVLGSGDAGVALVVMAPVLIPTAVIVKHALSEDPEFIANGESILRDAAGAMNWGIGIEEGILVAARASGGLETVAGGGASAGGNAVGNAILKVRVGLPRLRSVACRDEALNPDLVFSVPVQFNLSDAHTGQELMYGRTEYEDRERKQKFRQWVANDGADLRSAMEQACAVLSQQLTDELCAAANARQDAAEGIKQPTALASYRMPLVP